MVSAPAPPISTVFAAFATITSSPAPPSIVQARPVPPVIVSLKVEPVIASIEV